MLYNVRIVCPCLIAYYEYNNWCCVQFYKLLTRNEVNCRTSPLIGCRRWILAGAGDFFWFYLVSRKFECNSVDHIASFLVGT